jgi:histidine triad (HIT) family protein
MGLFMNIIEGKIPCYKIYEDDLTFAFLSKVPIQLGHTLVIPKVEVDYFIDVEDPYYSAVFRNAKFIARAVEKATGCKRVGASIVGLEVPHFHLHLIPMFSMDDMGFAKAKERGEDEMKLIQEKIIEALP